MPKAKTNLDSGYCIVCCPYEAAALITLGLDLATDNTPGIDNVYSSDQPWGDSGGLFDIESGRIEREPDFLGSVKYYIKLASPDGYSAKGLRLYWAKPSDVWEEIASMPEQFAAATNPHLRYKLKESLRALMPAAAVVHMRQAFSKIPRRHWESYPKDPEKREAWDKLETLHEKVTGPAPDVKKIKAEMERLWQPALEAAVQQCFANYQALKTGATGVLPAIRVRDLSRTRWQTVLPMNRHFKAWKIH